MEIRELKNRIETNLDIINNLWRSLWHPNKKRRSKRIRKKDRRTKFLE